MSPVTRRRWAYALLLLPVWLLAALAFGSGASAAGSSAEVQTSPAANAVLPTAPTQIVIRPGEGAETASGTAAVLDEDGKTVAGGALTRARDGLALQLPSLEPGVYAVRWKAGTQSAGFAFNVTGGAASPETLVHPKPETTLGPARDDLVEWIPLVAVMTMTGALALRFLVTAPRGPAYGRRHGPRPH